MACSNCRLRWTDDGDRLLSNVITCLWLATVRVKPVSGVATNPVVVLVSEPRKQGGPKPGSWLEYTVVNQDASTAIHGIRQQLTRHA